VIGSYDLGRHTAAPLGATWLIWQRLPNEGKRNPLGLRLLDSTVRKREPLPWPGTR
jgi:hypothetical protein